MPDCDEVEIAGAVKAILREYGDVIGDNQARNIAYTALVGARGAKFQAKPPIANLCAGGVDLDKVHYACPKCGAADNDACKFADY